MTAVNPATKAARQEQIAGILARAQVRSQEELAALLAGRGVRVTQTTLSRDLEEMGAVRLRGPGGTLVYALPADPGGHGSLAGTSLAGRGIDLPDRTGPAASRAGQPRRQRQRERQREGSRPPALIRPRVIPRWVSWPGQARRRQP